MLATDYESLKKLFSKVCYKVLVYFYTETVIGVYMLIIELDDMGSNLFALTN